MLFPGTIELRNSARWQSSCKTSVKIFFWRSIFLKQSFLKFYAGRRFFGDDSERFSIQGYHIWDPFRGPQHFMSWVAGCTPLVQTVQLFEPGENQGIFRKQFGCIIQFVSLCNKCKKDSLNKKICSYLQLRENNQFFQYRIFNLPTADPPHFLFKISKATKFHVTAAS